MAENSDNYLCFCVDDVYYMVSVMEVEQICLLEDVQENDLKWLRLSKKDCHNGCRRDCVIIVREGNDRWGIVTDLVEGIVQVYPNAQYEIPDVLQDMYPWLLGVAARQDENRLLLLLDGQRLQELSDGES